MGGRRVRSRINGIGIGIVCMAQVGWYNTVYTNPLVHVEPAPGVYTSYSLLCIRVDNKHKIYELP